MDTNGEDICRFTRSLECGNYRLIKSEGEMKGEIFSTQEAFEQLYLQKYNGAEAIRDNIFPKYIHKKTGKMVAVEYAKSYHDEWLYWVKNPVEKEHKIG